MTAAVPGSDKSAAVDAETAARDADVSRTKRTSCRQAIIELISFLFIETPRRRRDAGRVPHVRRETETVIEGSEKATKRDGGGGVGRKPGGATSRV